MGPYKFFPNLTLKILYYVASSHDFVKVHYRIWIWWHGTQNFKYKHDIEFLPLCRESKVVQIVEIVVGQFLSEI